MIKAPSLQKESPLAAPGSPSVLARLRNVRQAIGLSCLVLLGAQTGCFPQKKEDPKQDEPAPWALRDPQEVIPVDQMCFPSTVPVEVADGDGEPPHRRALRRGLTPEQLERSLYDRTRTTGEYEVMLKPDGGTMITFTPTAGAYDDLLAMYPLISEEAINRHASAGDLELTGTAIAEWSGAEAERVRLNRQIEEYRLLKLCLGFEIDDPLLARVATEQQPYPQSWTDQFLADPRDPGLLSGSELIDEQNLYVPPFVPPEGQKLQYVSFNKLRGDHLSALLRQVVDTKYHDQISRLAAFVRLTSPEGEWRIPAEYLNPSEQLGMFMRSLEFAPSSPENLQAKYWGRGGSLRKMLLRNQYKYHRENGYLPFTEATRDSNIAQLTGSNGNGPLKKVAPTDQDSYVLSYIYESDPDDTEQAAHTYQETLTLIQEMGPVVDDALHQAGLPSYIQAKILITALGRTVEYQEALRAGTTLVDYLDSYPDDAFRDRNRNAAGTKVDAAGNIIELTAHGYFNAADASTTRIMLVDTRTGVSYILGIDENENLLATVRMAMYQFLADKGGEDLALGAPEGDHVHMAGVRAAEKGQKGRR